MEKKNSAPLLKRLPDRWPASADVIKKGKDLIRKFHMIAQDAAVAYLFKTRHTEAGGKIKLGSCSKQSPTAKMLHGWDFIIELSWDVWALMSNRQREAIILHEINHIDNQDGIWRTKQHDVEEFTKVIETYGLWKPDLANLAEVIREAEGIDEWQEMLPGM